MRERMYSIRVSLLATMAGLGLFASGTSAFYIFQDWAALNAFYARFQELIMSDASMRSLFIAEANQNAFRINCFADGVGVLLGAILAAIGLHGIALMNPP